MQGKTCFALAQTHQRLGAVERSEGYLERFVEVAQSGELRAQAAARCSLGVLLNAQGDFARAIPHLEAFFHLAWSLDDRALLDQARTFLGIAKGNAHLPAYAKLAGSDLPGLLAWKNERPCPLGDCRDEY